MATGRVNGGGGIKPPTKLITKPASKNEVVNTYQIQAPNCKSVITGAMIINSVLPF